MSCRQHGYLWPTIATSPYHSSPTAITQECCEQYWTSPGGKTSQSTNYTATYLPSRKLFKLDEPDIKGTAGDAGTSSEVMYSYGPPRMAKQKQDDQLEQTYKNIIYMAAIKEEDNSNKKKIKHTSGPQNWIGNQILYPQLLEQKIFKQYNFI